MSPQDKTTLLQSLLERVRRNASKPRTTNAATSQAGDGAAAQAPPAAASAVSELQASAPEPVPLEAPSLELSADDADAGVEVMELDEAEIVDITLEEDEFEAPAAAATAQESLTAAGPEPEPVTTDIDFEDEDERPPSSSRRPKLVASSLDEALAGAADEHEVPIKTPPPESGPQEALPPAQVLQQKPLELDEPAMEAELDAALPRPEQLGNTIELDEPVGPAPDLESLPAESGPQLGRAADELEAELRPAESDSAAGAVITPTVERAPSEAPELTSAVVPVSVPVAPTAEPRVEQLIPPATERVEPEISARSAPPSDVPVAAFASVHREFRPATFIELLDASLRLGG